MVALPAMSFLGPVKEIPRRAGLWYDTRGAEMSQPAMPWSARLPFPSWVRYASLLWLALWFPAYGYAWGAQNFLHVCDVAVILTCAGLWWSDALLLSSQAISSILADVLWDLDAAWRLFTGHPLLGGTEYMWDAHYPLWIRSLSLFHIVWPLILLASLRRTGYDRRGFALQCAIAAAAVTAGRFADPAENINYAFADPLLHRAWGPAPLHLAFIWICFVLLTYLPTHLVLAKLLPPPPARSRPSPR